MERVQMFIVVVDELDHACKAAEKLVRDLFSIAMTRGSRLIVLSIANKLDLTERLLLDLKACSAAPAVLPFMSYTAKQILLVLKVRTVTCHPCTTLPLQLSAQYHAIAGTLAQRHNEQALRVCYVLSVHQMLADLTQLTIYVEVSAQGWLDIRHSRQSTGQHRSRCTAGMRTELCARLCVFDCTGCNLRAGHRCSCTLVAGHLQNVLSSPPTSGIHVLAQVN
jgi:Cdc6-like AAA superfamily ATPase